jgi:hypothetical protein
MGLDAPAEAWRKGTKALVPEIPGGDFKTKWNLATMQEYRRNQEACKVDGNEAACKKVEAMKAEVESMLKDNPSKADSSGEGN